MRRITITRWIIGTVANNQNCDMGNKLNRDRAIACSEAGEYIARIYNAMPTITSYNQIDYLLNKHRHSPRMKFYENMEEAIGMIYRNCLKYEQSENGFRIPRYQENGQKSEMNQKLNKRQRNKNRTEKEEK